MSIELLSPGVYTTETDIVSIRIRPGYCVPDSANGVLTNFQPGDTVHLTMEAARLNVPLLEFMGRSPMKVNKIVMGSRQTIFGSAIKFEGQYLYMEEGKEEGIYGYLGSIMRKVTQEDVDQMFYTMRGTLSGKRYDI